MINIAVIGLGYVGLPVALAIAKKFPNTVGFDINTQKIAALRQGIDSTGESQDNLKDTTLKITSDIVDLADCNFFIVAVPTPIDNNRVPDIIHELQQFGIEPLVQGPLAENAHAQHEYGIQLSDWKELTLSRCINFGSSSQTIPRYARR